MKIIIVLSGIMLLVFTGWLFSCDSKSSADTPAVFAKARVLQQVDHFEDFLTDSLLAAVRNDASSGELQQRFLRSRLLYKRFEWAAEYFMPATTRFVNGAPLPEIETEEHIVKEPEGLQVMEAFLYPTYDTSNKKELVRQTLLLKSSCIRYRNFFNTIELNDAQIFDAVRMEFFRTITMGITGFDAALSQNSMQEVAFAWQSGGEVMEKYVRKNQGGLIGNTLLNGIEYLTLHRDFNSFDRAAFIVRFANPLCRQLLELQKESGIDLITENRLLRPGSATLFEENVFNPDAFVPDSGFYSSAQKILLGKRLFSDAVLSANNKRSCATCHQPGNAFADGLVKADLFDGSGLLTRNTPSLINAALQASQFYDFRASILENQAMAVIASKDEMHGSIEESVIHLRGDSTYQRQFARAFPQQPATISPIQVMNALAAYIRSLTSLNSPFDQYMRGNTEALSLEQVRGFNLFAGKAKCATCHFIPLFNGTVPPAYLKSESEVIGVPVSIYTADSALTDRDKGRFNITAVEPFLHAFKTTTVRNAALTAPYMHNGSMPTLASVITFYNRGGGAGMGQEIPNQTLPFDKLQLSLKEQEEIISFIRGLTNLK